jgi:hypothetical protein
MLTTMTEEDWTIVLNTCSPVRSGYLGRSFAKAGHSTVSAACSPAVMRIVPAGFARSRLSEAGSASRRVRSCANNAGQHPDRFRRQNPYGLFSASIPHRLFESD